MPPLSTTVAGAAQALADKASAAELSCEERYPTTEAFFNTLSTAESTLVTFGILLVIITASLFIWNLVVLRQQVERDFRKVILSDLCGLFPTVSICAMLALTVPSTLHLMKIFIPFFFAKAMQSFSYLIRDLFGGKGHDMVRKLSTPHKKHKINIASPPLCCIRICGVSYVEPSLHVIRLLEFLIWQAAVLQTVLAVAVFIGFSEGKDITTFGTVTDVIKVFSALISMGASNALCDVTERVISARYRVTKVLRMLQLSVLFINLQPAVISILTSTGAIKPMRALSATQTGEFWNDLLLCYEMLLCSVLNSWLFRPKVCDIYYDEEDLRNKKIAENMKTYGTHQAHQHLMTPEVRKISQASAAKFDDYLKRVDSMGRLSPTPPGRPQSSLAVPSSKPGTPLSMSNERFEEYLNRMESLQAPKALKTPPSRATSSQSHEKANE